MSRAPIFEDDSWYEFDLPIKRLNALNPLQIDIVSTTKLKSFGLDLEPNRRCHCKFLSKLLDVVITFRVPLEQIGQMKSNIPVLYIREIHGSVVWGCLHID